MNLSFTLNGKPVVLEIEPRETLAEVLRNRLRLTGTKISCEAQVCGSCTVLVEGLTVSSCTMLAYEVRGRAVTTIEGLEDAGGNLHPVQKAFLKEFAFQCGFCTPGMILSAKALLDEHIAVKNTAPSDQEIIHFLDGNICRCTGYLPILKAVRAAAAEMVAERRNSP